MPPLVAIHPELRALVAQLKSESTKASVRIDRLADSVEILRNVVGDLRDELIRSRHATESLTEAINGAIRTKVIG